jgi:FAD/FMN-containing dehydrogenase
VPDRRFDQMEAFLLPTGPGQWGHLLEAVAYHGSGGPPDDARLLAGLGALPEHTVVTDRPFSAWANRIGDLPRQPHPWIDLVLPAAQIATFVAEVKQLLVPLAEGDSHPILLIPLSPGLGSAPLFRAPDAPVAFVFDILRSLPTGGSTVPAALRLNRRLYDRCRQLGGTHYPISAIALEPDDWVRHYGDQWSRLVAAKRRFDPDDVFGSGPDVLGPAVRG